MLKRINSSVFVKMKVIIILKRINVSISGTVTVVIILKSKFNINHRKNEEGGTFSDDKFREHKFKNTKLCKNAGDDTFSKY